MFKRDFPGTVNKYRVNTYLKKSIMGINFNYSLRLKTN